MPGLLLADYRCTGEIVRSGGLCAITLETGGRPYR